MATEIAPGLPADWLNGWLAAIGVTVVLPDAQLSWTEDAVPLAIISVSPTRDSLPDRIADFFADPVWPQGLSIGELGRRVTRNEYGLAAARARLSVGSALDCDFSLSSSVTDLMRDSKRGDGGLPHSPFDPPAPGTTGAVFDRLNACLLKLRQSSDDLSGAVRASLAGHGSRVQANGLGFDPRRLPSGVQAKGKNFVDPVVEILCFFGLSLFPIRGNGRSTNTRGWRGPASKRGSFSWPVWSPALDVWGVDSLLDRFFADEPRLRLRWLGVSGAFRSVPYRPLDERSDPTRAYASEPVRW